MALFRPQRASLHEAMQETVEVKSLADVQKIVGTEKELLCKYYCYDDRIEWETWIIGYKGGEMIGFSNGELK